jgi:protein-tyrosine-phosphatase
MNPPPDPSPGYKAVLKRLVPASVLAPVQKERGIYFRLGPKARALYIRLRLFDMLGLRGSQLLPRTAQSFLFICFGNMMRSPMAEALMKQEMSRTTRPVRIASAGIHAEPGTAAHPWSLAASADFGIALDGHRAQLLTAELVRETDAIFAMDFQNKAELLAQYPDAKHKIFMLSAYLDGAGRYGEIPDPYSGGLDATRRCYRVLQTCVRNLAAEILPVSEDDPAPPDPLRR